MHIIKKISLTCLLLLPISCSTFFEKDNTPPPKELTNFTPEITPSKRWQTQIGAISGSDDYLKMNPVINQNAIYLTSTSGTITSVNKETGATNWQVRTKLPFVAGPGAGNGIVVAGTRQGDIVALRENDGAQVWKTSVPGEVLANPNIGQGVVLIKTVDGNIRGLSAATGQEIWSYQQNEPTLILRGSSMPRIQDNAAIVGFASGNLNKLNLQRGHLYWERPVAESEGGFAIQRMIDIDADPIVYGHHIFAATYQGKIASFGWNSGNVIWSQNISSYTGMVADDHSLFISDAKSHIWAFDSETGRVKWQQALLEARTTSAPAELGNYVVVGDAEGYLHWLNKQDGHFAARQKLSSSIYAAPLTDNHVLYALTKNGYLTAYTLS